MQTESYTGIDRVRSRWQQTTDEDGTVCTTVTLTRADQEHLSPYALRLLIEAGMCIEAAFAESGESVTPEAAT